MAPRPQEPDSLLGARTDIGLKAAQDNLAFENEQEKLPADSKDALEMVELNKPEASGLPPVTVVGSGDFGQALAGALVRAGYSVALACRDPERARSRVSPLCGRIMDVPSGLAAGDVIVLALPHTAVSKLPPMAGKVVLDVSNRSRAIKPGEKSYAEEIQKVLPNCDVVKVFNTVSAYGLNQEWPTHTKQVPICGNSFSAKQTAAAIVQSLGFVPRDSGSLENARQQEALPLQLYPSWKWPLVFTAALLVFYWLIFLFRTCVCPRITGDENWSSDTYTWMIFGKMHLVLAITAFQLLTLCYTPGVIAAYIQLFRRTKYSQFPNWLDAWLKSRKQLGLLALYLATCHMIAGLVPMNAWEWSDWRSQAFYLAGLISLSLMGVLGITSLPSVQTSLSWMEFSVTQRYLGWWSFVAATFHVVFIMWDRFILNFLECHFIPHENQLCIVIPLLTILFKLPLLLPCVNSRLMSIRSGS